MWFLCRPTIWIVSHLFIFICFILNRGVKRRRRNRQRQYFATVIANFYLDEFKTFFRISRVSAEYLVNYISEVCTEENIQGIVETTGTGGVPQKPLEHRVLAMLWFLASQDKYASIADRFNFSESTANVAIRKLLLFIANHMLKKIIVWPSDAEQQTHADIFEEKKGFPGVIGMIDGTHIHIKKPKERGIDYYNRKDVYSVVLQGVVKEDLQFTDVYTGWPGKVHDARVFANSPLFTVGSARCGDRHILGDSAYPNLEWILTPYKSNRPLNRAQKKFNTTHASIRSHVERAFGLLKGRFVRLQKIKQKNINTIISTVLTACVLHNVCIINGDDFVDALINENRPLPDCDGGV